MGIKTAKAFYVTSAYRAVNTRGDRVRQGSGSTTDRQQRSDSMGELTAIPSERPASSETGLRAPRAEGSGWWSWWFSGLTSSVDHQSLQTRGK